MGLIHHQCCWAAARPAHVHTGRPVLPSWSLITDLPFLFSGLAQRECFSLQALSSVAQLCPTLCDPMACSMPGFPVHHQLPEFIQTHVHRVSDAIQPSHPQSSPSPPAFSLSQHHGLFKSVLHISEPKYWSFSFSISPSNEYSGLISFRID